MRVMEKKEKIEKKVKNLGEKPLVELRKIWKKVYGEEAPQHSRKYLIPRLAYRIQEEAYGEMSRKGAKRLEYLADRLEKGKRISSDKLPVEGTELILERGEEIHVVMVTNTGLIYREEFYTSLSAVAGKIMGMSYNGPLLFGMRGKKRVACEKYIKSKEGWVALAKRYDDGGFSGKNLERPAIKELFEDVKAGEVDCVVVYTLDRLSRETKDSIEVTSFFRRHRVNFIAVTQIFDNNTPMGKFVQTVLSGAAQLEREMIVERVKNKIATSKEQGLWMGGTLPLGYDVKDKELIINEKEAKTVKHIFERYMELRSMAELARELNREGHRTKRFEAKSGKVYGGEIFKKATVRRIITNPIYMGKTRHYEKQYEGKHEAIIEEEKWKKAQELIKNQPYRRAKYEEALLKGIIKCKSCNANMTLTYAKKENKRYRYYVCNNHLVGKSCESKSRNIVAGEVEKEVMKKAKQLYENWEEKEAKKEKWENLSFGKQKEVVKKLIRE
ncbi:site-specific recombinase [Trichonephila clavata]|uniref:Site-specific recombinase n=1 Tax=Trichonephila clavata TaxID=2740835 RepID=A0A8X6KEE2_TRICU|nr:site-specific recombinase [Trichonephila clavata]